MYDKWSCCSQEDFLNLYRQAMPTSSFCLEEKIVTTTTTTTTTTTAAPAEETLSGFEQALQDIQNTIAGIFGAPGAILSAFFSAIFTGLGF